MKSYITKPPCKLITYKWYRYNIVLCIILYSHIIFIPSVIRVMFMNLRTKPKNKNKKRFFSHTRIIL